MNMNYIDIYDGLASRNKLFRPKLYNSPLFEQVVVFFGQKASEK
jgi:hypothetical protein